MKFPSRGSTARAVVGTVGAGAVVGAVLLSGAATASADPAMPPPPNCSPADWAGIRAGVAAATSAYLFTHPAVNDFFATFQGQSRDEIRPQMQAYLEDNPQVRNELQAIKQPADDFLDRCNSSPGSVEPT
jgi:heme-binding protein